MAHVEKDQDDVALLTTALDHVTRWYEFRVSSALQVLNFFLLATAVMAAAYVSALNARLYSVAGTIALVGIAVSISAYLIARRQSEVARLASAPLRKIEDRLATALDIDSLRILERHHSDRNPWRYGGRMTAQLIFPVGVALAVAAAVYAWSSR